MTRIADDFSSIKRRMQEIDGTAPKTQQVETWSGGIVEAILRSLPDGYFATGGIPLGQLWGHENGPELFVPGIPGTIVPRNALCDELHIGRKP